MLDMGFINDIRKIVQTAGLGGGALFFLGRTMPKDIAELAEQNAARSGGLP